MKRTVYIETTIVSYLTARPATDPLLTSHIAETRTWWAHSRTDYDLVTSEVVVSEAALGDPDAAAARLRELDNLVLLPLSDAARALALALVSANALPPKAFVDALHVAAAAVN